MVRLNGTVWTGEGNSYADTEVPEIKDDVGDRVCFVRNTATLRRMRIVAFCQALVVSHSVLYRCVSFRL